MKCPPYKPMSPNDALDVLQNANARIAELETYGLDCKDRIVQLEAERDAHQKMGAEAILRNVRMTKALEGFLNALEDGPENCSYLKYEEVRDAALKELGGPAMNEEWIKRESRTELEQLRIKLEKSQTRVAELEAERDRPVFLDALKRIAKLERELALGVEVIRVQAARIAELESERMRLREAHGAAPQEEKP